MIRFVSQGGQSRVGASLGGRNPAERGMLADLSRLWDLSRFAGRAWMLKYGMWAVYAIVNKQSNIYVGMTNNIQIRIAQHNANRSTWTKFKGPWKLIYQAEFTDSKIAGSHEKYLKGGAGRRLVKESIARVAELADAQS